MKNKSLSHDYRTRAGHRLKALKLLLDLGSHADVVREAQEIVELCLKALLREARIEVPRLHDVSDILLVEAARLPIAIKPHLKRLCQISRRLRRDRELAFYGAEDLTPSEFYKIEDATQAYQDASWVYEIIS